MTLQEILKANGVADDAAGKILSAMKENKIFTAGEENLDIRYAKLQKDFDSLAEQDKQSKALIDQLKAGTKDNEGLQGKITAYETQVAQLQEQLKAEKIENAVKVALIAAKATDLDYMTFKLKEKGPLELDNDGKVKGIDDKIAGLKVRYPQQFASDAGGTKIDVQPLEKGETDPAGAPKTLAEALKWNAEHPQDRRPGTPHPAGGDK